MADSKGTHGHGTTLSGATTGAVGYITRISNNQSRDSIDISNMGSTDKFREFIAGMADAGSLTFDCNLDNSAAGVHNAMNTAYQSGTKEVWTVTFPDTSSWACSGFITSLPWESPYDDKMTQGGVTIKLSGKPTFTDVA